MCQFTTSIVGNDTVQLLAQRPVEFEVPDMAEGDFPLRQESRLTTTTDRPISKTVRRDAVELPALTTINLNEVPSSFAGLDVLLGQFHLLTQVCNVPPHLPNAEEEGAAQETDDDLAEDAHHLSF
jgi:hypothetical protein